MELRSVRGMMQLQSSSQSSRNGVTRPDKEYGILSLKWMVKLIFEEPHARSSMIESPA